MKDFKYYETPGIKYFGHVEASAMRDFLINEVNLKQLTSKERIDQLANIPNLVQKHAKTKNTPYNTRLRELEAEFWSDARNELQYDKFLNLKGCEAIEAKAYEDGHSYGFSEVYGKLEELVDFAKMITDCVRNE